MTAPIFISFDRSGATPYVDGLARFLTDTGRSVWYDREVGGDERWARVVGQLQACAVVVVVMTPETAQSAWVAGEISYARQLGKPVLGLLLAGEAHASVTVDEDVRGGGLPGPDFVARLPRPAPPGALPAPLPGTALPGAPLPGAPVSGTAWPGPGMAPTARKSRTGLIIGLVLGSVALLVCGVVVGVGVFVSRLSPAAPTNQTWQERAASIKDIHNYLKENPEWYQFDPRLGNHRPGALTYPTDPPAGGVHNPVWQNCMGDVYDKPIAKEHVMHSLEHGAVWVTYRPDLPKDQVDALARLVRDVPYTLLSPYPGQDRPISLQAWGYQLKVTDAGDKRVGEFIDTLRMNATQEPMAPCSGGVTDTGTVPLDLPVPR